MEVSLFVLLALIVISIIDLKYKAIPSILMTGLIFVVAIVNSINFIYAGLLGIYGLLLYESRFFSGVADIKASVIIGFVTASHNEVFLFMLLIVAVGVLYKLAMKYISKGGEEIAFLPAFLITYIITKSMMSMIWGGNWLW